MAYAKCYNCGWSKYGIATLKEAQGMAALHYRLGPCLLAFGYPDSGDEVPVVYPYDEGVGNRK